MKENKNIKIILNVITGIFIALIVIFKLNCVIIVIYILGTTLENIPYGLLHITFIGGLAWAISPLLKFFLGKEKKK